MPASYQLVIDCTSPEPLARFWAEALHYVIAPPPTGFPSWDDWYRSVGVPDDELGIGADRIEDPNGEGPRIWFQVVPEQKSVKNRLHLDINASGGRGSSIETRRELVDAEATRLVSLGATRLSPIDAEVPDHYAVALLDPEGNEFDIN
ncbi:glyoxalase [Humibacillus sp. DSM 29435]|uniref:VOC family protein n=1 Tax=Humibacillus sp. DSM 29435 TaxID=1869167 RepID=UPI0008726011|nr:VOC family protein [Humibacillus sp. DSM 29435]OFE18756.1 glyoxalase [Humibacillus sp. DSM 29435]